jgi:hypothetical protein
VSIYIESAACIKLKLANECNFIVYSLATSDGIIRTTNIQIYLPRNWTRRHYSCTTVDRRNAPGVHCDTFVSMTEAFHESTRWSVDQLVRSLSVSPSETCCTADRSLTLCWPATGGPGAIMPRLISSNRCSCFTDQRVFDACLQATRLASCASRPPEVASAYIRWGLVPREGTAPAPLCASVSLTGFERSSPSRTTGEHGLRHKLSH